MNSNNLCGIFFRTKEETLEYLSNFVPQTQMNEQYTLLNNGLFVFHFISLYRFLSLNSVF